jgi:hypothetical protein
MIPAEGAAPSADDPAILARLIEALRPRAALLQPLLASFPPSETGPALLARLQADRTAAAILTSTLATCYYTDDRVMRAVGMEARPPSRRATR